LKYGNFDKFQGVPLKKANNEYAIIAKMAALDGSDQLIVK
jgi:hypothetical protein